MRLYSGYSPHFIEDSIQNQIAEKLKLSFFEYFRYQPPSSEVNSWRNSLRAFSQVLQYANLLDHGIILEYQLPLSSKRLDCLISGKDINRSSNAVIVELKQWEGCEPSFGENEIITYVGRNLRSVLHPSAQVKQYNLYLKDNHTAFYEDPNPINLESCSYLHNYTYNETDHLFDNKFKILLDEYPIFTGDKVNEFCDFLKERLEGGDGLDILRKIEQSKYKPSKKLMEHIGNVIKGKEEYILLDAQKVVYDQVLYLAKKGFHNKQKFVFIIRGGPGTGKSVIALNLMADLLLAGYNAHYATGSRAFTETLRKIIGTRGSSQFKYFNSYINAKSNEIDVLICDEAHRIRTTSNSRYTPKEKRSEVPQIDELIKSSKVSVFFIDDLQVVRPGEIGSYQYIYEKAKQLNCKLHDNELDVQFRCGGSDSFINWIDNTLDIRKTANILWNKKEEFDFKIFDSPIDLEEAIREKDKEGFKSRMTAGFCWDWSKAKSDGTLVSDIIIGNYERPWNARPEATRLANGIPKATLWAHQPEGIDQVGCVYTAQGFEFDYAGVIFGLDLRYNFEMNSWEGFREDSYDSVVAAARTNFIDLIKNTYRVLLTRGMKGCYVYFLHKPTENFFRSRME